MQKEMSADVVILQQIRTGVCKNHLTANALAGYHVSDSSPVVRGRTSQNRNQREGDRRVNRTAARAAATASSLFVRWYGQEVNAVKTAGAPEKASATGGLNRWRGDGTQGRGKVPMCVIQNTEHIPSSQDVKLTLGYPTHVQLHIMLRRHCNTAPAGSKEWRRRRIPAAL